jgi:dimethylargininase
MGDLIALTRWVGPELATCELTHLGRAPIDTAAALAEHAEYLRALRELCDDVVELPALPEHPDGCFVEDAALVFDECVVLTRPGATSRRGEVAQLAPHLPTDREHLFLTDPATLDGGDVLVCGDTVFVGWSTRTNHAGLKQLAHLLLPHGYRVKAVEVTGCLHLKSALTLVAPDLLLANPAWANLRRVSGVELLQVHPEEPASANALAIGDTLIYPAEFPRTADLLRARGLSLRIVPTAELQKAEAGVTCRCVAWKAVS